MTHSDAGTKTCAGYPGSLGNEAIDAETFTEWGIDCTSYYSLIYIHRLTGLIDLKYGIKHTLHTIISS